MDGRVEFYVLPYFTLQSGSYFRFNLSRLRKSFPSRAHAVLQTFTSSAFRTFQSSHAQDRSRPPVSSSPPPPTRAGSMPRFL
eukprot:1194460-Prorocentrum_minimum.AAC.2